MQEYRYDLIYRQLMKFRNIIRASARWIYGRMHDQTISPRLSPMLMVPTDVRFALYPLPLPHHPPASKSIGFKVIEYCLKGDLTYYLLSCTDIL